MTSLHSTDFQSILKASLIDGTPYDVVVMNEGAIDRVADFHQSIIDTLPSDHCAFILPKKRSFFQTLFEKGVGRVIGVVTQGKLIAQGLMLMPTQTCPDTGMVDMEAVSSPDDVSVFQAVSVNPDYRGNRLMRVMTREWLKLAGEEGRTHAIAEVDVHNVASWASFVHEGMDIVSLGFDPDDGTRVYNIHEEIEHAFAKKAGLSSGFNRYAPSDKRIVDLHDLDGQENMFSQGYVGVEWSLQQKEKLILRQRNNSAVPATV
jgi:ribosomal protein S18 acetylase RimI-like enzyme